MIKRIIVLTCAAGLLLASSVTHASVVACADPCNVPTRVEAYLPPVIDIVSGSSVQWQGIDADTAHPTSTQDKSDRCFLVPVNHDQTPVPIRFDITNGGVSATEPFVNAEYPSGTSACTSAHALGDGSYVLQFQCQLHPWMNGIIRVEP